MKYLEGAVSPLTMAKRLLKPSTGEGVLVNFCLNASDRLWAGSVEMMSTDSRLAASWTAKLDEHVVFPTPGEVCGSCLCQTQGQYRLIRKHAHLPFHLQRSCMAHKFNDQDVCLK